MINTAERGRSINSILACPDCHPETSLTAGNDLFSCPECRREFPVIEDGIISLMPVKKEKELPFYRNEHYKKALSYTVDRLDYVENDNKLFSAIHHSGHRFVAKRHCAVDNGEWIIDVGSGNGAHLEYYDDLSKVVFFDVDLPCLKALKKKAGGGVFIQGDASKFPFLGNSVRYIVSIYSLEHMFWLERTVTEFARILKDDDGLLLASIPCEGGALWGLGRKMTTERTLGRRWGVDYSEVIRIEHCNSAPTVLDTVNKHFDIVEKEYFPFNFLRSHLLNLTIGVSCRKRS